MRLFILLFLSFSSFIAHAEIKIAVASNFKMTLIDIAKEYKHEIGKTVIISSASTGILFNQIMHGAPFDLFLSADVARARLIESSPQGVMGSRFTYARGQLAFWQPKSPVQVTADSLSHYKDRIAIADPKLAPYGLATKQALISMKLWKNHQYIQGTNIVQTYQFIDSGNINAGFVAYVLVKKLPKKQYYLLPTDLFQPIEQQGVILAKSRHLNETKQFVNFLKSAKIKQLIQQKGYL
ncbi:MAG: molybdate ABC transporter substrate-binding protein [Psychromonas sp.]|nr:molybdate ABC transporter substrate-binding protein [Psychromonas sp.]